MSLLQKCSTRVYIFYYKLYYMVVYYNYLRRVLANSILYEYSREVFDTSLPYESSIRGINTLGEHNGQILI